MAQKLGRVERPMADRFTEKRKLLLVPLVSEPPPEAEHGNAIVARYWVQVREHVATLENGLGPIRHIYHEHVTRAGSEALEHVKSTGRPSVPLMEEKCGAGATFEAFEQEDTLFEVVDLQRLVSLPFASEKVAQRIQDWYAESAHTRFEQMAQAINETLGEDEIGLLLIGERHQLQFPTDVEVFYVSPPALDEYHRWVQAYIAELQRQATEQQSGQEAAEE